MLLLRLLLMGSDETQNSLNTSLSGFDNIVEKIPLQISSWDMVRTLESISICDFTSDWVDALVVAVDFAKQKAFPKNFGKIRILLVTNFITSTNDSNCDVIIESIKNTNVEVIAISDCIEHSSQMKTSHFTQDPSNQTLTTSQRLFMDVIKQVDGFLCHIDLAEAQLLIFQKKAKKATPWNVPLSIGSKLKIEISAYVSIEEEKFLSSFKTESSRPNTITKLITEFTQNNQAIEQPVKEDMINAYLYGSMMVPLGDENLGIVKEKCLSCLGFTKRELVLDEYRMGSNCHVVLPRKDNRKSAKMFAGLITAMKQMDLVMIARKVYNRNNNPSIVVLLPEIQENVPFLTMIQLAFANDIALFSFPRMRTKKTEPSKEQERVIQEFVEAMDLMDAASNDDGITEAFALETSLNPVNQHLCRSVAFRALHPGAPLPKMDPELVATIDVPLKLKKASEGIVKKIEEMFPLEAVERKVKKVFGQRNTDAIAASDDIADDDDDDKRIIAVGTVSPAEDFAYLLKKGARFSDVADQLKTVIYDLIFRTASIQTQKVLECIMMYREQAKLRMPFDYNQWIKEMKNTMIQRNRVDLWNDMIVKEGFGLISVNEAPISTVSISEQIGFYEIVVKNTYQTAAMDVDDDELADLA
jgi:ATP-dependent DNA helicase 2 subunit 2